MLTPEEIANLTVEYERIWATVENDILYDIGRRIAKGGEMTSTADYQLWRMNELQSLSKDTSKTIAKYAKLSQTELKSMFKQRGKRSWAHDKDLYTKAGILKGASNSAIPHNNILTALYRQTQGTLTNLTRTTAKTVTGEFERALDRAHLQILTGAFTKDQAVKMAVNDLAKNMSFVTYPSGHTDTLEVATARATRTGITQATCQVGMENAKDMGRTLVEVTAHGGRRPDHAEWQGKVYSLNGETKKYKDFYKETGYGTGEGLGGWNCRHHFFPYFEGISERAYTDKQLEDLNARNIEYKGKLYTQYEINQKQRALERRVRTKKKEYIASKGAGIDTAQAQAEYQQAYNKLVTFANDTGGYVNTNRLFIPTGKAGNINPTARWKDHVDAIIQNQAPKPNLTRPQERGNNGAGRVGSNIVNRAYIASQDYSHKFNRATDNPKTDDLLRKTARSTLHQYTGTDTERLVIFTIDGEKIIDKVGEKNALGVILTEEETELVRKHAGKTIAFHNHPTNLPPTGDDFATAGYRGYKQAFVGTHDGRLYEYEAGNKPFSSILVDKRVDKYTVKPYNLGEEEAHKKALEEIEKEYGIKWQEKK